METGDKISGRLFIDPKSAQIAFVSKEGQGDDDTGLPWDLLNEKGVLEAFRRDFAFEELKLTTFFRFKIDVEVTSLRRWFEVRRGPG